MGEGVAKIFWLASYPKSGNTWTRLLLNAYKFGAVDINANVNVTSYDCNLYHWRNISPFHLDKLPWDYSVQMRGAVLLNLMASTYHHPIIMKTHNANKVVADVELIPQPLTAGAVYIIRDPRDVAVSLSRHMGESIDMSICKMNMDTNTVTMKDPGVYSFLDTWSNHVNSWMQEGICVVKYEDMKENPQREFTRILNAFNITADKKKVKKAVELCNLNRIVAQEEKEGFIEKGNQEKFFGQGKGWQNELTPKQARRIEEDHGEVMKRYGYL